MPVLDSLDYERFSYDDPSAESMSLDEAVKKAKELRKGDSQHFYRIEAIDQDSNSFRVEKVSVASVYAEFLARIAKTMGRYMNLPTKR
jgi:hypothetical protein